MARFASGVTIVTSRGADGGHYGMTVSAFASLSLDPPLVLACVDNTATVLPHLRASELFGVSVLAAGQSDISARFAEHDVPRFEGVAHSPSVEGPALIDGAVAYLICRRVAEYPGGDHVILVGEVMRAEVQDGKPLIYVERNYTRLAGE